MPPPPSTPGRSSPDRCRQTRRSVLGAVAGATIAGTAGCARQARALLNRDRPAQVSLSIQTVPADADPRATRVAQSLRENLAAVGIDASVTLASREHLYRDVLVNQQFDLYVARFPGHPDPDFLRGLLHSRFAPEPGWQNPFGYVDLDVDRLLDRQRRQTGSARRRTLADLQGEIVRTQPFSVVAFPDEIRACRTDRVTGWTRAVHTPLGYLSLERTNGTTLGGTGPGEAGAGRAGTKDGSAGGSPTSTGTTDRTGVSTPAESPTRTAVASSAGTPRGSSTRTPTDSPTDTPTDSPTDTPTDSPTDTPTAARGQDGVQMALTDIRALENLNPLSVAFRDEGVITGLLYDTLGRWIDGRIRPWLAASWRWRPGGGNPSGDAPALDVRLRDGLTWHDGTRLTGDDVAFTYRFLRDTSLGNLDGAVPPPRFRGRATLVTESTVVDDRTVRLHLRECPPPVARRALTVPVLPAHAWRKKAREATVAGLTTGDRRVTEALVWGNRSPVGSGPLELRDLAVRERLALAPFEDHFLTTATDPHLRPYAGGFGPDSLTFQRAPSGGAAVSMVRRGGAAGTATDVLPGQIPRIGRTDEMELFVNRSIGFYHVGFNVRRRPLGNTRFRRAIARLIDREFLVETAFDGFAGPAISPLARHEALAPELKWQGRAPVLPFAGEGGHLDVRQARRAFQAAGFRYGENGRLLTS